MHKYANKQGYTIVEVLIFLAISSMMFVIAAGFISGKQDKAQFQQGMSNINSKLQQVINDVGNGFYPSTENFSCSAAADQPVITSPASATQGSNSGCTFMGKLIQFRPSGVFGNAAVDNSAYRVFTVVGRQYKTGTNTPPGSFADSQPVINANLVETNKLQWGIRIISIKADASLDVDPTGGGSIGVFGIYGGFGNTSGGSLNSGSQSTYVIPTPLVIGKTSQGLSQTDIINGWNGPNPPHTYLDYNSRIKPLVQLCFQRGDNEFGKIVIGGNNGQRLTTTKTVSDTRGGVGCL